MTRRKRLMLLFGGLVLIALSAALFLADSRSLPQSVRAVVHGYGTLLGFPPPPTVSAPSRPAPRMPAPAFEGDPSALSMTLIAANPAKPVLTLIVANKSDAPIVIDRELSMLFWVLFMGPGRQPVPLSMSPSQVLPTQEYQKRFVSLAPGQTLSRTFDLETPQYEYGDRHTQLAELREYKPQERPASVQVFYAAPVLKALLENTTGISLKQLGVYEESTVTEVVVPPAPGSTAAPSPRGAPAGTGQSALQMTLTVTDSRRPLFMLTATNTSDGPIVIDGDLRMWFWLQHLDSQGRLLHVAGRSLDPLPTAKYEKRFIALPPSGAVSRRFALNGAQYWYGHPIAPLAPLNGPKDGSAQRVWEYSVGEERPARIRVIYGDPSLAEPLEKCTGVDLRRLGVYSVPSSVEVDVPPATSQEQPLGTGA